MKHSTNEVIMIRPASFQFNAQTAVNNLYQNNDNRPPESVQEDALKEFDALVSKLETKGIKVNVFQDTPDPSTPDSIFPNNWFSTHENGNNVIYPMYAENRQSEVDKFIDNVIELGKMKSKKASLVDYRSYIEKKQFLEGTGSIVLDRENKIAYCVLSPRSDKELFLKFCEDNEFEPVAFNAYQEDIPVYHTNVIMGVGKENVIICLDSITDEKERNMVVGKIEEFGKQVIDISLEQVKLFLGNTLELVGEKGNRVIAMSTTAYKSLTPEQKSKIEESAEILHSDISTIEFYGGGSVRCMIAELF